MAMLPQRIMMLNWLSPEAQAASLGAALPVAGPEEAGALVERLLTLARGPRGEMAARMLVRHGESLPAEVLERLGPLLQSGRLQTELAAALREETGVRGALRMLGRLKLPGLAGHLVALLSDADGAVAREAEAQLLALCAMDDRPEADARERAWARRSLVAAAVRAAEEIGTHHRRDVLGALCSLAERGERVLTGPLAPAWLTDQEHPALLAVRRMLRRSEESASRAAAWLWMKVPALAPAAAERLARPTGDVAHESGWMLERAHWSWHPSRRGALSRLVRADGAVAGSLLMDAGAWAGLSTAGKQGFARVMAVLPAPAKLRDAALGALLSEPEATVRYAAQRAAVGLDCRAACLLDFCFDPDRRVARSAALAVLCQRERGLVRDALRERTVRALRRSPVPAVAWAARQSPVGGELEAPEAPAARVEVRRRVAQDGAWLEGVLEERLGSDDPREVEPLVQMLRRTGLAGRSARRLVWLLDRWAERAHDAALGPGAARLAATIATALGDAHDDESAAALARTGAWPEVRVRANAMEAQVKRARRGTLTGRDALLGTLADQADTPEHRVRANAARGLLLLGGERDGQQAGARLLLGLLRDARGMHRAAGLWLTERMAPRLAGSHEVVEAVAAAARTASGPDDPVSVIVAARAQRAARRLIVEMRAGWSQRAAVVSAASASQESAA
jgi:hypothetical protein